MEQEQSGQHGEHNGSERLSQGRYQDEEDGSGENEEDEPASDLLRMEGQLESVQSPPFAVLRARVARHQVAMTSPPVHGTAPHTRLTATTPPDLPPPHTIDLPPPLALVATLANTVYLNEQR